MLLGECGTPRTGISMNIIICYTMMSSYFAIVADDYFGLVAKWIGINFRLIYYSNSTASDYKRVIANIYIHILIYWPMVNRAAGAQSARIEFAQQRPNAKPPEQEWWEGAKNARTADTRRAVRVRTCASSSHLSHEYILYVALRCVAYISHTRKNVARGHGRKTVNRIPGTEHILWCVRAARRSIVRDLCV